MQNMFQELTMDFVVTSSRDEGEQLLRVVYTVLPDIVSNRSVVSTSFPGAAGKPWLIVQTMIDSLGEGRHNTGDCTAPIIEVVDIYSCFGLYFFCSWGLGYIVDIRWRCRIHHCCNGSVWQSSRYHWNVHIWCVPSGKGWQLRCWST